MKNFHRQRVKLSHKAIGVPITSRIAQTISASRSVRKIALQSIGGQCSGRFAVAVRDVLGNGEAVLLHQRDGSRLLEKFQKLVRQFLVTR